MKFFRFAAPALALALGVSSLAVAMDHDVEQMQARLAAQEARLNDLQAKASGMYSREGAGAEGVVSIRKNAVVTIGGLLTTKYTYTRAKAQSVYERQPGPTPGDPDEYVRTGNYQRRAGSKTGDLSVSDAEIAMQIDVNDHFEAFVNIDLQNGSGSDYYNAETYYVRWKDICNSGFGIKVGRDALVFGEEGFGELASYAAGSGDGLGETDDAFQAFAGFNAGGGATGSVIPLHNGWDVSGVTQITPYWEGLDGKLSFELSFMQNIYDDEPLASSSNGGYYYRRDKNGVLRIRSKNYGLGTMSARAVYTPAEDLRFSASIVNYRMDGETDDNYGYSSDIYHTKNNTAFSLAASYRPEFFSRLYVWGQWVHGNNVYFHRGMKSDAVNFGAAFDLAEGLTFFAQGDYLRTKYDFKGGDFNGVNNQSGKAWAFYTGLQYSLPYGVSLEAGWKHEQVRYKDNGERTVKVKGDTIYAMAGFEF